MKFYTVDYGTTVRIMGEKTLHHLYETEIDHTVYPDYECWFADMIKCGLVAKI